MTVRLPRIVAPPGGVRLPASVIENPGPGRGTALPRLRGAVSWRGAAGETADLAIRDLRVSYAEQEALRGVSLDVAAGACVAVLGANGAGKSSLLNAVSGLHRPVGGDIRLGGRSLTRHPPHLIYRLGVCHIPEGRAIFPELTVSENLRMTLRSDPVAQERALEHFPALRERLRQQAGTLSGGEQQMLALAPAVATDYRVLLVDELSLGLAPVIVDDLFEKLARLRSLGVSILIVEQFADRALELADTAYVLRKGQVVLRAPAADLRGQEELLRQIYLGGPGELLTAGPGHSDVLVTGELKG